MIDQTGNKNYSISYLPLKKVFIHQCIIINIQFFSKNFVVY